MIPTQRALLVLAAFAILGIAPCRAKDPSRASTGNVEVAERERLLRLGASETLAHGESATIEEREGVRVRFARVAEDSRCPEGVACVWAGRARVELEVSEPGKEPSVVVLEVAARGDLGTVAADLGLFAERLDPHPRSDRAIEPAAYRLTVRLEAR